MTEITANSIPRELNFAEPSQVFDPIGAKVRLKSWANGDQVKLKSVFLFAKGDELIHPIADVLDNGAVRIVPDALHLAAHKVMTDKSFNSKKNRRAIESLYTRMSSRLGCNLKPIWKANVSELIEAVRLNIEALNMQKQNLSTTDEQRVRRVHNKTLEIIGFLDNRNNDTLLEIDEEGNIVRASSRSHIADGFVEIDGDGNVELNAGERLGAYIKSRRVDMGMTLEDVVRKLAETEAPLSEQTLRRIERGWETPERQDVMQALGEVLNASVDKIKSLSIKDVESPVGNVLF